MSGLPQALEAAISQADALAFASSGKHLNDLQRAILAGVWHGERYGIIAERHGYTEGHIKDVGAHLWQLLSQAAGERIGKGNFRTAIARHPAAAADASDSEGNFVGREAMMAEISATIARGHRTVVIQGEGGIGKTTLAQQYLACGNFDCILELLMAKDARNLAPAATIVQEWLSRDLQAEPSGDFATDLARLRGQLQAKRVGVLVDNLEPALDRNGCLQAERRDYVELLRALGNDRSQSITLVTSRDRLCEADLNFVVLRLSGLSVEAWEVYFGARSLGVDPDTIAALQKTYGGNAKAMGIISGAIATDFAGDGRAYWQAHRSDPLAEIPLKNLIASQFDRLQGLDPPAYHLLCRLGCYRYQDIASLPLEGLLCLLWDDPSQSPHRTIAALRNRSLVECAGGQYWLHPAIRAEAVARATPDWQRAHQQAAAFWRDRIETIANVTDALTAFEAYYHELAIGDFAAAARTILRGRTNQWGQFLSLGSTLYRLGLVRLVLDAIAEIGDRLSAPELVAELQNILGDACWIAGCASRAIACQEKAIACAQQALSALDGDRCERRELYYFQMLLVDSFLSLGLYYLDLGELARAAEFFERTIAAADNTDRQAWADKATICWALAQASLGNRAAARDAVARLGAMADGTDATTDGRWAFFLQLLGHACELLGDLQTARHLSERAIAAARGGHYRQIEARATLCLARVDAAAGDRATARCRCERAIELLATVGAKCDLAAAYHQYGLLLLRGEDAGEGRAFLERALALFAAIPAPQRAAVVRAALRDLEVGP